MGDALRARRRRGAGLWPGDAAVLRGGPARPRARPVSVGLDVRQRPRRGAGRCPGGGVVPVGGGEGRCARQANVGAGGRSDQGQAGGLRGAGGPDAKTAGHATRHPAGSAFARTGAGRGAGHAHGAELRLATVPGAGGDRGRVRLQQPSPLDQGRAGIDATDSRDRPAIRRARPLRSGAEPAWRHGVFAVVAGLLSRRCSSDAGRLQRRGRRGAAVWRRAALRGNPGLRREDHARLRATGPSTRGAGDPTRAV